MRGIDELLGEHPFFVGLDDDTMALLAGCAANIVVPVDAYLFREGDPADTFYVIRRGRVAIEVHRPAGGSTVIETIDDDEVLGTSWLVPPYRWQFDARAVEATRALVFDGACLRRKCDEDPRLGYALMLRVAQVMHARLQAARVRLTDLYGVPGDSAR